MNEEKNLFLLSLKDLFTARMLKYSIVPLVGTLVFMYILFFIFAGMGIDALGSMGPHAAGAAPSLVRLLTKGPACHHRLDALDINPAVLAHYMEQERMTAAELVAGLTGPASPAGPQPGTFSRIRKSTAEALGRIGPEAKEAVPALERLLKDSDGDVRKAAAEALEKIRGPGEEARE